MGIKNRVSAAAGACLLTSAPLAFALPAAADVAENPAESAGLQLEEVTITAQKRTERLADVSVAASVVSSDSLSRSNAGDISDLNKLVPSVGLVGTFNGRVPLGMRGISSNANESTVGLASGVAIMVDGVPVPSDSQSANQLEDVRSIEVLKGPQATLGGRTAAAGIINIVTRSATAQATGDLGLTATNDHEYRVNAFIGGPLTDGLLGSVAAYGNKREFPLTNLFDGKSSHQQNYGVRGKLLIKPNDALDITLIANLQQSKSYGSNFEYTYLTPGAYLLFGTSPPPLPPPVLATLSQTALLAGITPSRNNEVYNSLVTNSGADVKDANFSANIDYRIGDLTLSSTTAYQHETQLNVQDVFVNSGYFSNDFRDAFAAIIGPIPGTPGTWSTFNNTQTQNIGVKQVSEELKLVSPSEDAFNYVVGLFYSDSSVDLIAMRPFTPAATFYDVISTTKTYDIYGRATWKFAPTTSVTAGLRFNHDKLAYNYQQFNGGTVSTSNDDSSNAAVGDVSLQQKIAKNAMVYATYARGYAPKVFNTGVFTGGDATAPTTKIPVTDQEHIDHFEIGSKGSFLEQRLQLNAALFYTVYKDYQIQTFESIPGRLAPILGLTPAGKARTEGVELDTVFAATELTRISFNAAYIDAKFVDYKDAPCWGNGVTQTDALGCHDVLDANGAPTGTRAQDVSGQTMPNSPRFKATLAAEQLVPLGSNQFEGVIGGDFAYRSRAQFQPDQNPETLQGSFGILNLSFSVREKSGKYSVTAFCNNVTNHHYFVDLEDFWSGPWGSNAVVGQPGRDSDRYYGVRLKAGF